MPGKKKMNIPDMYNSASLKFLQSAAQQGLEKQKMIRLKLGLVEMLKLYISILKLLRYKILGKRTIKQMLR